MSDIVYFSAVAIALCLGLLVGFAMGFEYKKKTNKNNDTNIIK